MGKPFADPTTKSMANLQFTWSALGLQRSDWCWDKSKPTITSNEITAIPELIKTLALEGAMYHHRCHGLSKKNHQNHHRLKGRLRHAGQRQPATAAMKTSPCSSKTQDMPPSTSAKPLMETMVASKPDSMLPPAISTAHPGKLLWAGIKTRSPWLFGSERITRRSLRKHLISSPASKTILLLSSKPSGNTGVSKMFCTGAWTSLFKKTNAGYAKTMLRRISASYATWPSTCLNAKPPSKEVFRPNALKRHGITTIC